MQSCIRPVVGALSSFLCIIVLFLCIVKDYSCLHRSIAQGEIYNIYLVNIKCVYSIL